MDHSEGEAQQKYTAEEVARRAKGLYEQSIREQVEPEHNGRFLALDIESDDYELADEALRATMGLRERKPGAVLYLMRVGRRSAFRLGGRDLTTPRA